MLQKLEKEDLEHKVIITTKKRLSQLFTLSYLSDPSESYGSSDLLVFFCCDLDRVVSAGIEDLVYGA